MLIQSDKLIPDNGFLDRNTFGIELFLSIVLANIRYVTLGSETEKKGQTGL